VGAPKLKSEVLRSNITNGKKVRNDRLLPAFGRLELAATVNKANSLQIINLSETGVALKGKEIENTGSVIDLVITLNNEKLLYDGIGQIRWAETDSNGDSLIGISFATKILDRGLVKALDTISLLGDEVFRKKHDLSTLPSEYREFIFNYRNFLRELKSNLDDLEEKMRLESYESRESHIYAFENILLPRLVAEINNHNHQLDKIASKIKDKKTRKIAIDVFQKEVASFITPAPFTYRALKKPLGHSGDYEMMNQIYRNQAEGQSLFEKVIHKAGVNESSSLSVRFRRKFLKQKIKDLLRTRDVVKIASIACGPAKEIVDLIPELTEEETTKITFVLVDQELEALLNAKREILSQCLLHQKSINIEFAPQDIRGIIEGSLPEALSQGNFDLIYSAGLFDYLLEAPAKLLSMNLLELIKQGGKLLIGNFHPDNPTKTISEFSVNWKLYHRSEEEMLKLIPDGAVKEKKLIFDDSNIEIFIEATK